MKRIAIIANCEKVDAPGVLRRLEGSAKELGLELLTCDGTAEYLSSTEKVEGSVIQERAEAVIALGGDGTLLHAAKIVNCGSIPILGINLGNLGFMTSVPEDKLEKTLEALSRDEFISSQRTMLKCEVESDGEIRGTPSALNDVVIGWGESSRIISLEVLVEGENVLTSMCDGLIVSTPTGSTGHSMSAGGPIIHPQTAAFSINMICPHTLSNRPLVVPDTCPIEIKVSSSSKSVLLAVDGQDCRRLKEGDLIRIAKAERSLELLHLPEYSYFEILKHKLHWRGSVV